MSCYHVGKKNKKCNLYFKKKKELSKSYYFSANSFVRPDHREVMRDSVCIAM